MSTSRRNQLSKSIALAAFILLMPTQEVWAQPREETVLHVVTWGETVSSIAAKYGVAIDDIVSANHLAGADMIFAGQTLVIPGVSNISGTNDTGRHIVQLGETLYRISLKYGVSTHALMAANSLTDADRIYAGQTLIIPQETNGITIENSSEPPISGVHIVKSGETLFSISQRYGISVSALQATNDLLNPSQIFVGQHLLLPGASNVSEPGYTPQQTIVTHIVQPGENLSSIATRYGVSLWVIAQSNNISNTSLIYTGQVLSIPSNSALSSTEISGSETGKSIIVDVSEQRTYVYDNGVMQQAFVVSTGLPGQETRRGRFQIQNKIPVGYAATWDLQMPYWLGFYWAGPLQNGFHALPILSNGIRLWEGLLGSPASYGCVILSDADAQWLYEWANIGTPVTVQD